ncbi:GEVED domain-containing protein, partial [Aequorivita echinoideorum]
MHKNYFISFLLILIAFGLKAQTITQTYNAGDIPTSYTYYSATCNGPLSTLALQLPAGGPWEVTGFDVFYSMTAANGAWMSEQRSLIHFQNNGQQETVKSGTGTTAGTFNYNRTGLLFANGFYPGGTNLNFEMRSWRTYGNTSPNNGCGTYYNKVNNNSWNITVYYQAVAACLAPQNLQATNITKDQAQISWTEIGTATQWNLEYGLKGFAQGSGTLVNVTNNNYLIANLSDLTQYDVYVQSNCASAGLSLWAGPLTFKTAADCTNYPLSITSTTGDSVVCKGTTTLTAVGSGDPNAQIFWYDAASGGNIVGRGPTFQTPIITSTTSFWAAEVLVDGGTGGSGTQNYCIPTYPTGCTASDDIDNFIMTDAGINHIGSGCSPGGYGNFTNTAGLTGNLIPGNSYPFSITHNFSSQWVKIWIDFNQNGVFSDPGELLFTSNSGSNNTVGSISIPASAPGGVTVMRVMDRYSSIPTDSCNPGGTWGETHDYQVLIGGVLCESPRVEVVATVSQDGDIIVPPALPYIDANNNTSNYGNTFTAAPGSGCGST